MQTAKLAHVPTTRASHLAAVKRPKVTRTGVLQRILQEPHSGKWIVPASWEASATQADELASATQVDELASARNSGLPGRPPSASVARASVQLACCTREEEKEQSRVAAGGRERTAWPDPPWPPGAGGARGSARSGGAQGGATAPSGGARGGPPWRAVELEKAIQGGDRGHAAEPEEGRGRAAPWTRPPAARRR